MPSGSPSVALAVGARGSTTMAGLISGMTSLGAQLQLHQGAQSRRCRIRRTGPTAELRALLNLRLVGGYDLDEGGTSGRSNRVGASPSRRSAAPPVASARQFS